MTNPMAAAVEAACEALWNIQKGEQSVDWAAMARMERDYPDCVGAGLVRKRRSDMDAAFARMAEAGWVMVPREATDEMADAGRRAGIPAVLIDSISGRERMELKARYAAMVRAAMLGRDDPPRADGEG